MLPACTQFETWGLEEGWKYGEELILQPQIFEPPWETKSDYAICAAIAEKLGIWQAFTEGRDEKQWVEALLDENDDNAQALGMKALIVWREGDLRQAQRLLDRALRLAPEDVRLRNYRGIVAFQRRDFDGALDDLEMAVDLDPGLNPVAVATPEQPDELATIYQLLDQLEPVEQALVSYRPRQALGYVPLVLALLVSFALALRQLLRTARHLGAMIDVGLHLLAGQRLEAVADPDALVELGQLRPRDGGLQPRLPGQDQLQHLALARAEIGDRASLGDGRSRLGEH